MADTPSSILLTREQSTGSNTNLWGGYLITTQRTTERALRGYQALTVTGDTTVSWTNYSATNDYGAMVTKLNGSPTAAWAHTLPGYTTFQALWNNTGQTGTFKNSGGTGVSVPTGRRALVFGDATDIREASPNWLSNYASTLTNAGDIVVKTTLETAIATASLPATAGTLLNSAADTTAGYLSQKVTVNFATATTTQLSGLTSLQLSTQNSGGNEKLLITVQPGYVAGYLDGGRKDTAFTASGGYAYTVVSGCTFLMESAPSDMAKARIALFNPNATYGIDPNGKKINGSTSVLTGIPGGQTLELTYDATLGDWE